MNHRPSPTRSEIFGSFGSFGLSSPEVDSNHTQGKEEEKKQQEEEEEVRIDTTVNRTMEDYLREQMEEDR